MQRSITIAALFLVAISTLQAQTSPLIYEVSQKFDVQNARMMTDSDGENNIITSHTMDLEDYGIGLNTNGQLVSSVFSGEEAEMPEYNFSIFGDKDVVLHDFNFNEVRGLLLADVSDSVTIVSEGFIINEAVFPQFEDQVGVFHVDANSGEIVTSYYIAPESSIHRTYPLEDKMVVTTSFKDSLIYVDPSGVATVVQGESEYNACVMAIDFDGGLAWSYLKPTLGLSFVRSVAVIEEVVVAAIDGVNESYIVSIDDDGVADIDLTFPWVNIHQMEFDDEDNLFMIGQYREVGGEPVNIGLANEFFLPATSGKDAFLAMVDEDGDTQWAQVITGSGTDTGVDFHLTDDGEIYTTGCFEDKGIFDQEGDNQKTLDAVGGEDVFVAKYLMDGSFVWAEQIGGTGTDIGTSIVADFGSIVVFGTFQNEIDVNTSDDEDVILEDLLEETTRSFFFASYEEDEDVSVEDIDQLTSFYPNPANDIISVNSDQNIRSIATIDGNVLKVVGAQQADVSDMPSGLYLVSIVGQSSQEIQLLTIQR